jgi:hypothetical protein
MLISALASGQRRRVVVACLAFVNGLQVTSRYPGYDYRPRNRFPSGNGEEATDIRS